MIDLASGVAQAAVGLCFAYAAVAKFIWFRDFQQSVASFGLLPEGFVRPAGIVVVALEAAVGFSFLVGGVLPWGTAGAMLLLAVFGFVIGAARRRGIAVACNCFGPGSADATSPKALWRLLLLGAGVIFVLVARPNEFDAALAPLAARVVAGGCVLVAIAIVLELPAALFGARSTVNQTVANHQREEQR